MLPSGWQCNLENNVIRVACGGRYYGEYKLLDEPYCRKCAYPGVTTESCTWHYDDYGFNRIYALGKYISSKTQEGYDDLLSKHIRGLKKYPKYSEPLGSALSLCMKHKFRELLNFNMIVPAPKHKDELVGDGFNQAIELAKVLSTNVGIPWIDTLRKQTALKMKGLSRELRKTKVKGLYKCSDPKAVRSKRVILLDDVSTSGSTASECSQILINAGARVVSVLVAGRDVVPS